jgi:hypothetical protein
VLDVHARDHSSGHEKHCPVYDGTHENGCNRYDRTKRCYCGYDAIETPCEASMLVDNAFNEEEVYPVDWIDFFCDGWEPGLCGLAISMCTTLESLDIHLLGALDPLKTGWVPWGQQYLFEMFFIGRENSPQSCSKISGLSTLKRLRMNTPVPWSMINLPGLHTLEIHMIDIGLLGAKRFMGRPTDSLNTTITKLVVDVDLMTFARFLTLCYLDSLFPYLVALRHLCIRFST